MKSVPFAMSTTGGRMSEGEYLPGLLLNVERSKKGGKLFKKSGEAVSGIAELAIPVFVSSYARRKRGILILHQTLHQKKLLSFPEIAVHDLQLLGETFNPAETGYEGFVKELSTLITSVTTVKEQTQAFDSLPAKEVLDDLKELLGGVCETEDRGIFLFETESFEENREIEEIHRLLECQEDRLSDFPSHLDEIQELIRDRSLLLIANLGKECEEAMAMRRKKRRDMIDAFKINAAKIKQLKRDNDEDEARLLSDRIGHRNTIEYRLQQIVDKQRSATVSEDEQLRLKGEIARHRDQLRDIDRVIREIKENAANRRRELHNQLLALDEQMDNFDNETESIRYEYKEKMQNIEGLLDRLIAAKEAYIVNAKNALADRINELSISLPMSGGAEDVHRSFLVYIPAFIALFEDEKAGTQRYQIFPPKSVTAESKSFVSSVASSLLQKFGQRDRREGLDTLLTDNVTNRLMNDQELKLKLLKHMSNNSILGSSSPKSSVIIGGAERLRSMERISEKEYTIIKSLMEVQRQ
jgi:hypothetical protein